MRLQFKNLPDFLYFLNIIPVNKKGTLKFSLRIDRVAVKDNSSALVTFAEYEEYDEALLNGTTKVHEDRNELIAFLNEPE